MKRPVVWCAVLAASTAILPVWGADAEAETQPAKARVGQSKQVEQAVNKRATAERERVVEEAISAVTGTSDAIRALDKGDEEQALEDLATVIA